MLAVFLGFRMKHEACYGDSYWSGLWLLHWNFIPISQHNKGIMMILSPYPNYFSWSEGVGLFLFEIWQLHFPSSFVSYIEDRNSGLTTQALLNHAWTSARNARENSTEPSSNTTLKVCCITYLLCQIVSLAVLKFHGPLEWYPFDTIFCFNKWCL